MIDDSLSADKHEQRIGYKLSLVCFKISSDQTPSYLQTCFTFTPLLVSSVLLQTLRSSDFHPFAQSPVSALSITRLRLPGASSVLLAVVLPPSLLSNLP